MLKVEDRFMIMDLHRRGMTISDIATSSSSSVNAGLLVRAHPFNCFSCVYIPI